VENQSNSSNVREQNRLNCLKIYCDKKAGSWLTGFSFFNSIEPQLNSKKSQADYFITCDKTNVSFESARSGMILSLPMTETSAKLIHSSFSSFIEVEGVNLTEDYLAEIKKLFKKCNNLIDLINNFHSIGPFKSYLSSQVLIHEKGKSSVKSIAKHRGREIEVTNISVANFNNIFSKIKKSKNKLFDQSDILSDDIQVVGSFLAKEFNLSNHSIVFILSREDFFSPSDIEKEYFDQFLTLSVTELQTLVNSYAHEDKIEYFKTLVEAFPFYIKISSSDGYISSQHPLPKDLMNTEYNNIHIEYDSLTQLKSDPDYYHHERLILMGELLNTLRHELSNPLFGINISTNLLLSDTYSKDNEVIQTIEEVGKSSERCQSIIENFSGLYGDRNILQSIGLKDLIKETLTLTKSESKQFNRDIKYNNIDEEIKVTSNPTYLSQIIFNLIINSCQALKSSGLDKREIQISLSKRDDSVKINISDNGPGIPEELKAKVFDPFYTTKDSGTGLGLSICKNLAKKINGQLFLEETEVGASFSLIIPMDNE